MTPAIDPVKLAKLAEVAVHVGVALQPGQDLILTAPMTALPLVRLIVAAAYRAGAGVVTPLFADEAIALARYQHGVEASFDAAPNWLYNGMAEAFANGAARMAIVGDNPMLLANEDAARVARAGKANSLAYQPALAKIAGFDINWSICSYPGEAWARQIFPELSADAAVHRLAEAIFAASRVDQLDPVAAWRNHNATLRTRTKWLNGKRFAALRFTGPGTDLTVGLAEGHEWQGGASTAKNGVTCNPN
ncbi:MAG: aminopeptidase, partial [Cypionkella sp.]|nr:aminopeptidase [Cypionkella sp.]